MIALDKIEDIMWEYLNSSTETERTILEKKGFSRTHISEPQNDKFPSTAKLMNAFNRPLGSPIYYGDYEIATLILVLKGEDQMWNYWDSRLGDILDKLNGVMKHKQRTR